MIVRACAIVLFFAVAGVCAEQADTLYRWVDAEGVPHFGDQPPPGQAQQAERLEMPTYSRPELSAEDQPYSILNQLERMEAQRERLARERRERWEKEQEYLLRKRELEMRRQAVTPPSASTPVFVYPRHGYAIPPRPGLGSRPGHPRPPGDLWQPDHPAYGPYPRRPVVTPAPSSRVHVEP